MIKRLALLSRLIIYDLAKFYGSVTANKDRNHDGGRLERQQCSQAAKLAGATWSANLHHMDASECAI